MNSTTRGATPARRGLAVLLVAVAAFAGACTSQKADELSDGSGGLGDPGETEGDRGDGARRGGGAKKLDKTHGRLPAHGRTRPSGAGRGVS